MENDFNITSYKEEYFMLFFISKNLILDNYTCKLCGKLSEIIKFCNTYKNKLNYIYYCYNCNNAISIYKDTIFEKLFIDLKTFFLIIKYFILQLSFQQTCKILKMNGIVISEIQVYRYFEKFKDIIHSYYTKYIPVL
jgi:hypothetical protein